MITLTTIYGLVNAAQRCIDSNDPKLNKSYAVIVLAIIRYEITHITISNGSAEIRVFFIISFLERAKSIVKLFNIWLL